MVNNPTNSAALIREEAPMLRSPIRQRKISFAFASGEFSTDAVKWDDLHFGDS
ncbi:hypothetical protein SAMN05192543_108140 [Paraburkholderia megapolitana]|uniref:Uncharacterized protein n=1 Tax=Paraburkholderia megapolitana TaxID=420953 RepID=A0A1I3SEF9_9BURK|nr:hypothetical protein SAMN05192543_108140 [Paraburkholderia megapolitana]